MSDNDYLEIDLDRVIREKKPGLARVLPSFVTAYLKRLIHQDQINEILRAYSHLEPVEFVRATLAHMGISYELEGAEKIDPSGRYLFASNHPFGGLDGMILAMELNDLFGPTRIIVNDLLMHLRPISPLFIPINKYGRQNPEYVHRFRDAIAAPGQIATFPAGICSRKRRGALCEPPWKSTFVKSAIETRRDVVPVFVEGELSPFFYRLARLRTSLGIRANIEMMFLVDEMFRQQGRHIRIVFGDPVPWQELAEGGAASVWAARIKEMAYELKKNGTA